MGFFKNLLGYFSDLTYLGIICHTSMSTIEKDSPFIPMSMFIPSSFRGILYPDQLEIDLQLSSALKGSLFIDNSPRPNQGPLWQVVAIATSGYFTSKTVFVERLNIFAYESYLHLLSLENEQNVNPPKQIPTSSSINVIVGPLLSQN